MGTRNTLGDLTNHLFAELERLGDEDLKGDALRDEIDRAKAVSDVASQVISNANVMLRVVQLRSETGVTKTQIPHELTGGGER